jgi:hypothetical protein
MLVYRDHGRFHESERPNEAYREHAYEVFVTGVADNKRHVGIRTGISSSEIDYIVTKSEGTADNLDNLEFEIAKHGAYIPILDTSGRLLFSPKEYDALRRSFDGLARFSDIKFEYIAPVPDGASVKLMSDVVGNLERTRRDVEVRSAQIRSAVSDVLKKRSITLKGEFDTSIIGAQLLDTGSTGRGTNTPGDFDFDLMLRLDALDFTKSAEIAEEFKTSCAFEKDNSHGGANGYYQLRLEGVSMLNGVALAEPMDIDIGFSRNNDLVQYGTHDAISDKLENILLTSGPIARDTVVAGIVATKKLLKVAHAYKKFEGGLGGVGVENWLLLYGGNIDEAFKAFWEAAHVDGKPLPLWEFRKRFNIRDPALNMKSGHHDDYVSHLSDTTYRRMLDAIAVHLGHERPAEQIPVSSSEML